MNTKQVIVIRKDLQMRKGKMIAQGAHASMKVILDMMINNYEDEDYKGFSIGVIKGSPLENWLLGIFTKVVVGCDSEEELLHLRFQAIDKNIPNAIIKDAGKTEFHSVPTFTALAIGPDEVSKIDEITGHLKLL